jgi:hypothetical protein
VTDSGALIDVRKASLARRAYRGFVFALMVGTAGVVLSAVPGLFIQSIYIGEAQRCQQAQQEDLILIGEIETTCAENLNAAPVWLPPTIIIGGALMGAIGGFSYGAFSPKAVPGRRTERERSWLPF